MEPVRVLQVVGRMTRGGIETLIMNLYRNIDRTKVQFDFLCHYGEEAEFNEEIRALGGRIYEMPRIKSTDKTYYHKLFQYLKALNNFFEKHQEYNVLHGHMTNTASIYMPIAKKHGVNCCIAHSHLTQATKGFTGIVTNFLHMPLENIADEYFSCSEMAAKWLFSNKSISENKVRILNNAIDSKVYDYNKEIRNKYRTDLELENKFVLGHVGRFFHQKNHEFLIDVFNKIIKEHPNSILLLVGEGILKTDIEKKVESLNLSNNVKFLGMRPDVPELMQAMDAFVMPSHFEGLPLVGVEAQAAGLKCFMSDAITLELEITQNIEFIPLSDGIEKWANTILKYKNGYNRCSTKDQIIISGYDIKANAEWLQEFYIYKHMSSNKTSQNS